MSTCDKRFCEVTLWWNMYYINNQVSPHFYYYPAEMMRHNGFDVDVLTKRSGFFPEKNVQDHETFNGISITKFQQDRLAFSADVFRYMARHRYALVHLHTVNVVEDFAVWAASRLKKTPMVFTQHSPDLEELEHRSDLKALLLKQNFRLMSSNNCTFIAFTEWQKGFYERLGIRNVKVIPHGIDPSVFDVPKDEALAERLGLGENNILCVSNIDQRKGQHLLVESMPGILKERPDAKLLLVGRTINDRQLSYKRYLEQQIEKLGLAGHVIFLEDLQRDMLIQLYLQSDVFAFPTDAELFGIVLLEAMAAGLPVISTDRAYLREILQNGKSGLLVKREQRQFEEGILALLTDTKLRDSLVSYGKKAVNGPYLLKNVMDAQWRLYRSLIENGSRS